MRLILGGGGGREKGGRWGEGGKVGRRGEGGEKGRGRGREDKGMEGVRKEGKDWRGGRKR